ncbi:dethiobiotin synthase [Croceiramulus getboli]|nr:dethiobiotin synthase [Flavobacteriaceae bacterium YJPT1-3]
MSKSNSIFVTGISTEVGKTVASAIIVEALHADYYKPVQAGDLDFGDTERVQALVSNTQSVFHAPAYGLQTPMSPHAAAAIDEVEITLKHIKRPKTKNALVIEGAGGLLVPLNDKDTIADLIMPEDQVIVVSRHYLGSINHTLLTLAYLESKKLKVGGILFSGAEYPTTEQIILEKTGVRFLGRIDQEPYFDQNVVREYAERFKTDLVSLVSNTNKKGKET